MEPVNAAMIALSAGALGEFFERRRSDIRAEFERSPEGIRARRNRIFWRMAAGSILAAGGAATLLGSLVFKWKIDSTVASIGVTIILTVVVAALGSIVYRSALGAFAPQAALDIDKRREEEQEKLEQEIKLPILIRNNREQMYLYHQIATTQARVAGRNSQAAMAIGFLALVAGSAVAIVSDDVTTKLIIGGLAALGGVFSGYIARTFLVAQDQAIGQLYRYWEQPLTTSYILAAERVADTLDDPTIKEKELGKLIDQLLTIAIQREASSSESGSGSLLTRQRSDTAKKNQSRTGNGASRSLES
jgi:hypothetical protein